MVAVSAAAPEMGLQSLNVWADPEYGRIRAGQP
jgi:hypothetical protein